jgi:hypothetical protein
VSEQQSTADIYPARPGGIDPRERALHRAVSRHLFASAASSGETVYALLDGARDERIYPFVLACGLPHRCLFEGTIAPELTEVAPYLVELAQDHPFTEQIIREGWGQSWGIFVSTPAPLEDVRRHLRRFLRVETEDKKKMMFRYYDPRVLRVYLPTCTPDELATLFGPLTAFRVEGESKDTMLVFTRRDGAYAVTTTRFRAEP